jgi:hypothetical protein
MMLCSFSVLAQDATNNPHPYSLEVIPPNPTPGSLGKYLDIPVNYQTGTPQIEIPIFTIKGKQLSVPISLSYHASGLKVDDYASWVGAGWSLNAGGNISRTIRGLPDEFASGGLFNPAFYSQRGIIYPFNTDGTIKSNFTPDCQEGGLCGTTYNYTYHNQMQPYANGCVDSESDLYFFSLPTGKSGRFILDPNTRKPYFIPHQPVILNSPFETIDYSANVDYADYSKIWVIIDENGIEYTFGKYESRTAVDMNTAIKNYNRSCQFQAPTDQITTWHLLKMHSKQYKETIEFFYTDEGMEYDMEGVYTTYSMGVDDFLTTEFPLPQPSGAAQTLKSKTKRLTKITTSFGYEVNFGAGHQRQDVRPFQSTTYSYALTGIEVLYNGNVIKNMQMSYDYSLVDLTLTQIQEMPLSVSSQNIPPYKFFYKAGIRSQKYNMTTGFRPLKDVWGFAKTANTGGNPYTNNYAPPIQVGTSNYISYYVGPDGYTVNTDPLAFDFNTASIGMLNKVQYPTGGYSEITYEPYAPIGTHYVGTTLFRNTYSQNPQTQTSTFTVTGTKQVVIFRETPCGMLNHPYCSLQLYKIGANNTRILVGDYSENINAQQGFITLTAGTYEVQARLIAYDCPPKVVNGQTVCDCLPQGRGEVTLTPPNCANTYNGQTIKIAVVAYEQQSVAKPLGGHIRVKEINYYNTANQKAFSRAYLYKDLIVITSQVPVFETTMYQKLSECGQTTPTYVRELKARTDKGQMTNVIPGEPLVAYKEVEVMNQILDGEGYFDENLQMFIPPNAFNNGKSAYFYNPAAGGDLASVSENAKMIKQIDYKATWNGTTPTYQKVKEQLFTYGYESFYHHNSQTTLGTLGKGFMGFKVKSNSMGHDKRLCFYTNIASDGTNVIPYSAESSYSEISRWHVLKESVEKIYDPTNESKVLTTTTTYTYDSKNALPKNVVKTLNNGESISQITKFSSNTAGNATGTMLQRNILTLPLEQQNSRRLPNGTLEEPQNYILSATKTEYRVEQGMILPSKVYTHEGLTQGLSPNYVLKAEMDSYDEKGNVLSYHAVDGNKKSYIWATSGKAELGRLPLAEVLEASDNQIAFTSFETADFSNSLQTVVKGNWTYSAGTVSPSAWYLSTDAKTGVNSYMLEGSRTITKTGLPNGTYQVSFWVKGGYYQINLNGQNISPITSRVGPDGWELKQVTFTGTAANISISSGSCLVDELRLHPLGARMSTYTYHASGGFSSVSDPNQRIVYYEYDEYNRLKLIRDEQRNILKTFYYNYKQN